MVDCRERNGKEEEGCGGLVSQERGSESKGFWFCGGTEYYKRASSLSLHDGCRVQLSRPFFTAFFFMN